MGRISQETGCFLFLTAKPDCVLISQADGRKIFILMITVMGMVMLMGFFSDEKEFNLSFGFNFSDCRMYEDFSWRKKRF